jgi:hypothetical protein
MRSAGRVKQTQGTKKQCLEFVLSSLRVLEPVNITGHAMAGVGVTFGPTNAYEANRLSTVSGYQIHSAEVLMSIA